jgi:hypothetical protein
MMQNLLDIHLTPDLFGVREHCLEKLRPSQMERLDLLIQKYPALLSGAFFLRSTSRNGTDFSFPDGKVGDREVDPAYNPSACFGNLLLMPPIEDLSAAYSLMQGFSRRCSTISLLQKKHIPFPTRPHPGSSRSGCNTGG